MIRVLLVDDHELVRSGFRVILESQPDIEVIGEADNGEVAVALTAELTPHVICMDVEMPVMNGIDATRAILSTNPVTPPAVLVLTTFGHDDYLFDALAAGVSGFLLKTSRAEQLIDAVRTLAKGQALLGPDVTRAVMHRAATAGDGHISTSDERGATAQGQGVLTSRAAMDAANLTEREREVLAFIARGLSNGEIASTMYLGEATVKTHVSNLLQKIGARDRVQLVVWAHTVGSA